MNHYQGGEQRSRSEYDNFDPQPKPNIRQQNKLIAVFSRNNPQLLRVPEVTLNPGERESCLADISSGTIDPHKAIDTISKIRATHEDTSANDMFLDMSLYNRFEQIQGMIAVATSPKMIQNGEYDSTAFHNRNTINQTNIRILTEIYQNPADLEIALHSFMERIKANNNPDKFTQYQRSFRILFHAVYGKRAEYWEQYKLLSREAHQNNPVPIPEEKNLISNEGSIESSAHQNPDNPSNNSRKNDEIDAERLVPIIQMMTSMKKVPLIIYGEASIRLFSTPENPQITDQQSAEIIRSIGTEIRKLNPNISTPILRQKLLSAFQPATFARFKDTETPDGFATKNSLFRELVTHLNDKEYFDNM